MACSTKAPSSLLTKAQEMDYVRFTFGDMHGISRGKVVPRRHLPKYLEDGGPAVYCGKCTIVKYSTICGSIHGNAFILIISSLGTDHV